MDTNKTLFVRWVRLAFPQVYEQAVADALQEQSPATLSGLLDSIKSGIDRFISSVPQIAQTYVNTKAQIDWLKLNADRVKKGLPPLDPKTGQPLTSTTLLPPSTVQDQQVETALAGAGMRSIPIWIWIALAGGVALLLFKRKGRR